MTFSRTKTSVEIGLAVRSVTGIDIKNKDTSNEVSCLVAGEGLEPPASGL